MRFINQLFLLVSCMLCSLALYAQQEKVVQFSGFIQTIGTADPVGYVTIRNNNFKDKIFLSNHQGFFSFVAHEGDSITFTSVGFEKIEYVIPHTSSDKYTAVIRMKNLIHELPMVTPFPWASIEEFNLAFMALEIADDDILCAKSNVTAESLAAMARVTPRSADEIQNFNYSQRHIQMNNKYMNANGANQLFNPLAWGSLIQQISKGNQSRKK